MVLGTSDLSNYTYIPCSFGVDVILQGGLFDFNVNLPKGSKTISFDCEITLEFVLGTNQH